MQTERRAPAPGPLGPGIQRPARLGPSQPAGAPKSHLFAFIVIMWAFSAVWFGPRLWGLLSVAETWQQKAALGFFVLFMHVAWLYAFFNIGVIVFAIVYRKFHAWKYVTRGVLPEVAPPVAILYTTCNDFVEESALSCVRQNYAGVTVYICDDSSVQSFKDRIDQFAARFPGLVKVIRRPDRRGFKAGNVNHALAEHAIDEPFFVLADSDEVMPPDFLKRLVPLMLNDPTLGFVQANHRSNPADPSPLAKAMGIGIDIHWRWYHPLRNEYGFVMLLGHGALLRRKVWEEIGGFPELVSEDLAFTVSARELGYRGRFAEDVVCYENFPEDIRAFRIRHMKWTRGTCEFLAKCMAPALFSRRIPLVEKLDMLVPTMNLPLALFYFLFVIDANILLTTMFAQDQAITWVVAGQEFVLNTKRFSAQFASMGGVDLYAITVMTLLAPVLCFIIEMAKTPFRLLSFLSKSTAVYGALTPLSCLGVILYLATGKAVFHVTADRASGLDGKAAPTKRSRAKMLLAGSHPDSLAIRAFEVAVGVTFAILCLVNFQVAFLGLSLAFILLPFLHHARWDHPAVKVLVHVPFALIFAGLLFGALAVIGMQTVFFGYGFHF